jgi:hypothetical protein
MSEGKSKIVLITSGQPSLNPRLVKEADALIEAGYDVRIIYQYWNDWATHLDKKLFVNKKWKIERIGGDPKQEKFVFFKTRLINKVSRKISRLVGFKGNIAERSIGRCANSLIEKAKQIDADLYIAHNLAALPAAVIAAKKHNAKCGFDAEDLHRYEMSNDDNVYDVRLKTFVEEKYFSKVNYLTTSSDQIAERYKQLFPLLDFNVILNVFSNENIIHRKGLTQSKTLRLIWLSQNVGLQRGLQDVITSLRSLEEYDIELHILGFLTLKVKEQLDQFIKDLNFNSIPKIIYKDPIESDQLIEYSSHFDIGLATEPGFSINNDLALSNKFFIYAQAGLAIVASDTNAQKTIMEKYPGLGCIYERKNILQLAAILKDYIENPTLLIEHKLNAKKQANETLNWDLEKHKFLTIIKNTLK